jgi:hypothetical protein
MKKEWTKPELLDLSIIETKSGLVPDVIELENFYASTSLEMD